MASMGVGGAHEPRGTSSEYSPLTQLKAKDGVFVKEPDSLHKNGRVNELVGKQEGKMMKIEVSASNRKKSQAKMAKSMQCKKRAGFLKKDEKAGGLEACPSLAEHVGPCSFEVNVPGDLFIGPNLVVTTQAQLGVVKDSTEATHQIPPLGPSPFS